MRTALAHDSPGVVLEPAPMPAATNNSTISPMKRISVSSTTAAAREPTPASSRWTSTCSGVSTPWRSRRSSGAGPRAAVLTSSSYRQPPSRARGHAGPAADGIGRDPGRRADHLPPPLRPVRTAGGGRPVRARLAHRLHRVFGRPATAPRTVVPHQCDPVLRDAAAHGRRHPRDFGFLPGPRAAAVRSAVARLREDVAPVRGGLRQGAHHGTDRRRRGARDLHPGESTGGGGERPAHVRGDGGRVLVPGLGGVRLRRDHADRGAGVAAGCVRVVRPLVGPDPRLPPQDLQHRDCRGSQRLRADRGGGGRGRGHGGGVAGHAADFSGGRGGPADGVDAHPRMRVHLDVLRSPRAARGVRPAAPGSTAGALLIAPLVVVPQAGAADSLTRALRQVFARPEYRWTERRHPLQWLQNLWNALLEWVARTSDAHPIGMRVLWAALLVALLALLTH